MEPHQPRRAGPFLKGAVAMLGLLALFVSGSVALWFVTR